MKVKEIPSYLRSKIAEVLEAKKIDEVIIKVFDNASQTELKLDEFFENYNPEEVQKGQCNFVFRLDFRTECLGTFILKDMLNCSGVLVASDLFVSASIGNRGVGTLLNQFIIDFAKHYGYGVLQATDKVSNEYQRRIFIKLGWKESHTFINPKTRNEISMWILNLNQNENR